MESITYITKVTKTVNVDCNELINDCLDYMHRHDISTTPDNVRDNLYENLEEYIDNRGYYDNDADLSDELNRENFNNSVWDEINDLLDEMFDEE